MVKPISKDKEAEKRNKILAQQRIQGVTELREPERTAVSPQESSAKGVAPNVTRPKSEEFVATSEDVKRRMAIKDLQQTQKILDSGGKKAITPEQVAEIQDIGQQAQAPTEQPEQVQQVDLRLDQNIARIGLAIPVAAGNAITSILESVTGKQFGRQTTKELAQTGAGEALGLGIVGTGLAAGGLFAYETYLSGLSAQQLINIAGTKALPTSFRLPAVTSLTKLSTAKLFIAGAGVTAIRTARKDAKQAIIGNKETIADILEDVQLRGKSFSQATQELNQVESNINHLEGKITLLGRFDLTYWLSGGKDDLTDVRNTRNYLEQARFDLTGVAQQAVLAR